MEGKVEKMQRKMSAKEAIFTTSLAMIYEKESSPNIFIHFVVI